RTSLLGPIGHEHEAERRPLSSSADEDGAVAALVLDGHELIDRRAVLDLDEQVPLVLLRVLGAHREVGGEVLAAEPERLFAGVERLDHVTGASEDRFDQGLGDPAFDFEEIHLTSILVDVAPEMSGKRSYERRRPGTPKILAGCVSVALRTEEGSVSTHRSGGT